MSVKMTINYRDWNKAILKINENNLTTIIKLNNVNQIIDLHRRLTIAYFEDCITPIELYINNFTYRFSVKQWQNILSVTEQWFERYLNSQHIKEFV